MIFGQTVSLTLVSSDLAPSGDVALVEVVVVGLAGGQVGGLYGAGEHQRSLDLEDGDVVGETGGASTVPRVLKKQSRQAVIVVYLTRSIVHV